MGQMWWIFEGSYYNDVGKRLPTPRPLCSMCRFIITFSICVIRLYPSLVQVSNEKTRKILENCLITIVKLIMWFVIIFLSRYFDNADILDRIPLSFLVLGVVYLIMIFIGMLLMFDPEKDEKMQTKVRCSFLSNDLF